MIVFHQQDANQKVDETAPTHMHCTNPFRSGELQKQGHGLGS